MRLVWIALALPLSALANPSVDGSVTHAVEGSWRLSTPPEQLKSTLAAAVDEVAVEFNYFIRGIARARLANATSVCDTYLIDVRDDVVLFSCDDETPHRLPRDGSPVQAVNEAGDPMQGVVSVTDSAVVVSWTSESGTRRNEFRAVGEGVQLSAKVTSEQMPKPLAWSVDYAPR